LHGVVFAVLREPEPALPKSPPDARCPTAFSVSRRLIHFGLAPDGHRRATKSPDDSTTLALHGAGGDAHGAGVMRLSDLQLTPARVGLILLMLLLLGAIIFRVFTASEFSEVRPSSTAENGERAAPNTGVRGLRGSLQQ
jgi:hypothetical protein